MTSVGIRALKQNASEVVARAAAGEIVTITDRGRPVARLMPLGRSRVEELIDAGLMTPATRALEDLPDPVVLSPGQSLSQTLADMREDERY